jgi:hypothetical protein
MSTTPSEPPEPEQVLAAAAAALADKPGGRVFVYVDHGPDSEPAVFASGDDDTAADLLMAVGAWLDTPYDDEDDED